MPRTNKRTNFLENCVSRDASNSLESLEIPNHLSTRRLIGLSKNYILSLHTNLTQVEISIQPRSMFHTCYSSK